MKFTPSLIQALKSEMESNKGNCITICVTSSCCGKSISINSTNEKDNSKIKIFDEIPIIISTEDEEMLKNDTFDFEKGEVIIKSACACGNC